MGKAATTLVALVAAVIYYVGWGGDPKASACVREVNQIETIYRSHPPKSDSTKAIENTLKHARKWCGDGKFKDAANAVDMATFLCVAQKGCKPLLDAAKRQRQSAR